MLHWSPATWQGREYDNRSTPPEAINPDALDTDQWCEAARSFGAKQIVFVAKHASGFCWWQTETSDYGVRQLPWREGKADVLAELADSCRRSGLKLGIYVYPGDDRFGAGIGSGGRTKDPARQEEYNRVFRQQLTEVLTRYGEIGAVWFDGSCRIEVGDILAKHAPGAMVFQGPQATLRWVGNEEGIAPLPGLADCPPGRRGSGPGDRRPQRSRRRSLDAARRRGLGDRPQADRTVSRGDGQPGAAGRHAGRRPPTTDCLPTRPGWRPSGRPALPPRSAPSCRRSPARPRPRCSPAGSPATTGSWPTAGTGGTWPR